MVVYTIFQQVNPVLYPLLLRESAHGVSMQEKVAWIGKFRRVHIDNNSPWKEMLQSAKDTKYEDLKNKIKQLRLHGFNGF